MHTRSANGHASLGTAAKDVTDHAKTLVKLELELATLELKRKVAALGLGIGLLVVGAVLGLFGLGFALATVAAALATFLSTWLSLLIVALGLLLLMGVLVVVGLSAIKEATPPLPKQAIEEAKRTTEALRSDVRAH